MGAPVEGFRSRVVVAMFLEGCEDRRSRHGSTRGLEGKWCIRGGANRVEIDKVSSYLLQHGRMVEVRDS